MHPVPLRDSAGERLHRLVTVTYRVAEGPGFTLSRLTRSIADSGVARCWPRCGALPCCAWAMRYNEDVIGQERQRLEPVLKNSGYYDFRAQYITLEADTSFEKVQVRLRVLVASPPGGHRAYRLRDVLVLNDVSQARALRLASGDTTRRGRRRPRRRRAGRRLGTWPRAGTTGRISTASMPAGVTAAAVADSLAARRRRLGRPWPGATPPWPTRCCF
ncbi:MAG: hypothetical protein WKG07_34180 [Hymenobacter sp.]